MRGTDHQQSSMFSHISAGRRIPRHQSLRALRTMTDAAPKELSASFYQLDAALRGRRGAAAHAGEAVARAALAVECVSEIETVGFR